MRARAWSTSLILAALAVACGDQPTEVVPEREAEAGQLAGGGTIAFATASSGDGYSITTDKDDYQPGDVVHFTGAGWEPDDILDIVLTDEPQTHPPLEWTVTVGPDGTFTDDSYTVDEGDLNVTFTLLATSRSSGQSLSMTFTDGNLQNVTLTPASVSVPQTGTASSTINVTIGGNSDDCTVTLNVLPVPALPAGVGTSITLAGVPNNSQTGSTSFNRTLDFTTSAVTPGSYPFTVRAVRGANCQGSGNVDVSGTLVVFGAPHHLAFGQQPSNTQGGAVITPAMTVRVLDAGNNLVANDNTTSIVMAIQSNPGSGTLSGTTTRTAANGIATFNDLSIDKIGTAYTLRATSGALTGVTSSSFNITLGPAAKLLFTVQPTGANTNANLGTQPKVGVFDAGGNLRTAGSVNVALAVTPGTGTGSLSCTTNPVATVSGIATFAGCKIDQAGTGYRLRATSGTLTLADSDPFDIVNADADAPTVNCTVPNPNLWYGANVNVPCTASDASGLKNPAADASFTLSTAVGADAETETASTGNRSVCDVLDNCVTVGPFVFKVDRKAPAFSCGSADGAWHADDVAIACTASDGGSGLNPLSDASFSLTTSVGANTEDDNASTGTKTIQDLVGNSVVAGPIGGNKVDKKAPTFSCGSPDGEWHKLDVSIACTASDGGSGVSPASDEHFSLSTNVPAGTETDNASTGSKQISDDVGNKVTAPAIAGNKVDKKAPEISCGSPSGAWSAVNVTITCGAVDNGSGLASPSDVSFGLSTAVAAGSETDNAFTESKDVNDAVGNQSTAGPIGPNKIDRKAPVVTLTCPASTLTLNQPVTAAWGATEGGSGFDGPSAGTISVPTNPAGPHSVAVSAGTTKDQVGNQSSASNACNYIVAFIFAGFVTPVDNNNVLNGANSGQAIPLKWTLKDFNNAPVTTLTSVNVTVASLTCAQGSTTDLIEEYAAGSSGLINKGDGSYQFNWKTPTSYARSCKTLRLDLGEGTTQNPVYHTALFEFKK
jgi:hypothetical protein